MEILRLENVSFKYPLCDECAVRDVSLSVRAGDFVTVCGATGSGKTTLLRLIKRELTPRGELHGQIYLDSRPLGEYSDAEAASAVGFVMQSPSHQLVTDRVWHELAFSLENLGVDKDTAARRIAEISAYFGIDRLLERSCDELSGGEAQLVALAKVLATSPRLLLLDEPTKGLDRQYRERLREILCALKAAGTAVLCVTHDTEFAAECADRCAMFFRGRVVSVAPTHEFFTENGIYTTAVARMTRRMSCASVTEEKLLTRLGAREFGRKRR